MRRASQRVGMGLVAFRALFAVLLIWTGLWVALDRTGAIFSVLGWTLVVFGGLHLLVTASVILDPKKGF